MYEDDTCLLANISSGAPCKSSWRRTFSAYHIQHQGDEHVRRSKPVLVWTISVSTTHRVLILNLQIGTGRQHQPQIPQHVPLHNIFPKLNEDQADVPQKLHT